MLAIIFRNIVLGKIDVVSMNAIIVSLVLILSFPLANCTSPYGEGENVSNGAANKQKQSIISVEEAIRIAKQECDRLGFEYLEPEIGALWRHGRWRVFMPSRTLTIGGDISIVISARGEVIEVIGGK